MVDNKYIILPQKPEWDLNKFITTKNAIKVQEGFSYNSGDNEWSLSVNDLKKLLSKI